MMCKKRRNPITGEEGSCIAVARGATGIYLALKSNSGIAGGKVIVPANICYAAVYPIQYAGLEPVFCDVDPVSGNVTLDTFAAACSSDTRAAVIAHMYGNPVYEMPDIAAYCRKHNILLIEDCASAMGSEADHYKVGTLGDYVVYSTGYAKTLDLGYGGILFSKDHDLECTVELEKDFSEQTRESEDNMAFFSKLYRLMRNEGTDSAIEKMIYRGLGECCRDSFLQKISDQQKAWLFSQLDMLPDIIRKRRIAFRIYEEKFGGMGLKRYPFSEGAVPWRYNLLLEEPVRKRVIAACLENGLPISDWYPRVTDFFGVKEAFVGAEKHEKMILNFPLLLDEEKIGQICRVVCETAGLTE